MAILTSIGAVIAAKCTFAYLAECIIDSSASSFIANVPKLGERLRKQFSETKPEVNSHLQKAVLSSHWMATLVFVEQMHKKELLNEAYNNINITIKNELKQLRDDNYHAENTSPDANQVAKLIKLPKEEAVIAELRETVLDFHLAQLNQKTGNVKSLIDYKQLLEFIKNGWQDENLNWFSLMTAFLNQLLKGDNNNAKDAFQNQALADIQLKLEHFEHYADACVEGIGEERFRSFEENLLGEIARMQETLSGINRKHDETFNEVVQIKDTVLEIKNRLGEARHLNLNLFEQYRQLISDIDALSIEINALEQEKTETLEFLAEEESDRKKQRFEKDYAKLESEHLHLRFKREEKQKELQEFSTNIQKVWISVYTENSPRLTKAREALEKGDIDGANTILDDKLLQHDFEQVQNLEAVLTQKKESLANEFITKAELTVTQKSEVDWFEIANNFYEKATILYPSYHILSTYGLFLYEHNQFNSVEKYFKNALEYCTSDKDRADILNNLGNLHESKNELDKAEINYNEALEIFRKLALENPQKFLPDLASTLNNLGILHENQNELDRAEISYSEALEISRKLALENPQNFLPNLAVTLNNLGGLHGNENELDKAQVSYSEALEFFRKLAVENPQNFLPNLAMTLNNLGGLHGNENELDKAEISYNEALEIFRKLAVENPQKFLPDVAVTLNNLGILQKSKNELDKAEISYKEALEISRKLALENPQNFLPDLAMTLNNLGILHEIKNELEKAEISYNEALEIFRKLALENPQKFLPDLASTLNNLGVLQKSKNELDKAEISYYEALEIRRKLALDNPQKFLPDLAMTLNNLGILHMSKNELDKAEISYYEALEIRRKLALDNPQKFLPDLAMTLNNLGILQATKNKLDKSEISYNEALEIRRKLAVENPQKFLPDVAVTLNNLGILQVSKNELDKAEINYIEALEIRRKLAVDNPSASSINYATTAVSLAIFYSYNIIDKVKSIYFSKLAIECFSPFSDQVPFAAQWQKRAEDILKECEEK